MTRQQFDDNIEEIRALIHRMGDCVVEMIDLGVRCALDPDPQLVQRVRNLDNVVDDSERRAVELVVESMLRQSPVASDLRLLTSTLSIIGELEQAGDDAEKMASRAHRIQSDLPDQFRSILYDLAQEVAEILRSAISLYDHYTDALAERILTLDDRVDSTYKSARRQFITMMDEQPGSAGTLFRCISVFHALEHAADRAVEITKRLRIHYRGYDEPVPDTEPDL